MAIRRVTRVLAGVFAAAVAAAQLALFSVAERQVALLPGTGDPAWARWTVAVGWALPFAAAAVLLTAGATRRGIALLISAGALVVVSGVGGLVALSGDRPASGDGLEVWMTFSGGAVVWCLAVAAVTAAWLARPRGQWRVGTPGVSGLYVTLAVSGWLPSAVRSTEFAPPGAPRRFVETLPSQFAGVDAAVSIAWALGVAAVLFVAPRLRRAAAGTVLLGYALPSLAAAIVGAYRVIIMDGVILTPAGVIGLAGLVGLVVVGIRWAVQGREADRPGRSSPRSAGDVA